MTYLIMYGTLQLIRTVLFMPQSREESLFHLTVVQAGSGLGTDLKPTSPSSPMLQWIPEGMFMQH